MVYIQYTLQPKNIRKLEKKKENMREYAKMKKCKISFFFGLCVLPFEDPKQSITNDVSGKRLCNIQRKKYAKKINHPMHTATWLSVGHRIW